MTTTTSGPIAVIVAMQAELQHLTRHLTPVSETASGPWRDQTMSYQGLPLQILYCGVGMVNAAAAAEHVCDHFHPRAVLNFGCTGAHRRDLLPGDVVIGSATLNHGAFHILPDGALFYPAGTQVTGEVFDQNLIPCDPHLVALAQAESADYVPDAWPLALGWPEGAPARTGKIDTGIVASADIWTQLLERIDRIHLEHGTLCEDMEAAAINRVCSRYEVPFLTVKDISNNEYHVISEIAGDIEVLPAEEIGRRAAQVILRVLDRLAAGD